MFIDLVIVSYPVSTRKDLFEAPAFTHLEQGDEVLVQDCENNGKRHGIVVDSVTVTRDDDKYNFVFNALGVLKPLPKIKSIVTYKDLHWEATE